LFVNLLDMNTKWQPSATEGVYEGHAPTTGEIKWAGKRIDLVLWLELPTPRNRGTRIPECASQLRND
jgi:hypothetical protein